MLESLVLDQLFDLTRFEVRLRLQCERTLSDLKVLLESVGQLVCELLVCLKAVLTESHLFRVHLLEQLPELTCRHHVQL